MSFDNMVPIAIPYLLVSGIPCVVDKAGRHYVDKLWYKDLVEHCKYIKNLTLAAPCVYQEPPKHFMPLEEDPACSSLHFVALPNPQSTLSALVLMPKTLSTLWKAIGQASIVHSGVGNWPIPYAWLVTPIAKIRGKFQLINIESAFWRVPPGVRVSWKFKTRAWVSEKLARCCLNAADLPLFTEEAYKKSLLTNPKKRGYVIQASWIDKEDILTREQAQELWAQKKSSPELKLLFAGHLNRNKGVPVLLEAIQAAAAQDLGIHLDILGEGELRSACEQVSRALQGKTQVRLLGTVSYGKEFFQLIQNYHAVAIPSLTDEQPRIVFDAYSQAVPVLATNTTGLQECVQEHRTGMLVPLNDPSALASLMQWASNNRSELEAMGINALTYAQDRTHQNMHLQRWKLLLQHLQP